MAHRYFTLLLSYKKQAAATCIIEMEGVGASSRYLTQDLTKTDCAECFQGSPGVCLEKFGKIVLKN